MIAIYLTQYVKYEKWAGINTYNEPTYQKATYIKGRHEPVSRLIRKTTGEEITSSGMVFTQSPVYVDDRLADRRVIQVDTLPGPDGKTNHYEVYLL